MFNKILIANRGEIAVRIIRACREMGIETVAVYSEADRKALHTQLADEAICIGPASPKESYLNIHNIISATVLSGAQAIHPGFGFLSENSKFASICRECNITFIGPSPECIESMGNKSNARDIMNKSGIPTVPGSKGAVTSDGELMKIARSIGYPVMIKASAGGGGRGIRIVRSEEGIIRSYENAKAEAKIAFGDDTIYLEKFIESPKHIEIQILGDNFGNIVYLGERDCSLQRRHQKILEESPSPSVTPELRKLLGEAALKGARAVGYSNAGTVEFLLDEQDQFYFMEMNTRIQVEHPVTEMVTGIDLVKQQIRIAAGEPLPLRQEEIVFKGHAIECRINAEDPEKKFLPNPGRIDFYHAPGGPGIRIDSSAYSGCVITPYYDSMVSKLIAWGENREEAIARMIRALEEFEITGILSTILFHLEILYNPGFRKGEVNTNFINNLINELQTE
ncbi:MAG TPA: acetyl-CoA carboxylase biotin carboxylase subunit [Clostridium sp.]|nr:acetyl-CoA carboxylase biotin carboxylase subunit [Clostridium sp.]